MLRNLTDLLANTQSDPARIRTAASPADRQLSEASTAIGKAYVSVREGIKDCSSKSPRDV